MNWKQASAISFCKEIEPLAFKCGGHIALTGGLLYKENERKDIDIIIYKIRQQPNFNFDKFWRLLDGIGCQKLSEHGWVTKCLYAGSKVDFLYPEYTEKSTYPNL